MNMLMCSRVRASYVLVGVLGAAVLVGGMGCQGETCKGSGEPLSTCDCPTHITDAAECPYGPCFSEYAGRCVSTGCMERCQCLIENQCIDASRANECAMWMNSRLDPYHMWIKVGGLAPEVRTCYEAFCASL